VAASNTMPESGVPGQSHRNHHSGTV